MGAVRHFVLHTSIAPPFPDRCRLAVFGMGCFWGAEQAFWTRAGVHATMVGYAGGHAPAPDYRAVCTGATGHCEVVRVAYDPAETTYEALLKIFWEGHDPTQGMRQGNDIGSQYRSAIYCHDERGGEGRGEAQMAAALASRAAYQAALHAAGFGPITTEIRPAPAFHYAEEYHQQYLAKNPGGYCGHGGTGVAYPGV